MSRILFLDVDGVLNSKDYLLALPKPQAGITLTGGETLRRQINPEATALVNKITEAIEAKVVLSSTWRFMDGLPIALKQRGLTAKVIGKTPTLEGHSMARNKPRGHEIQAWMTQNGVAAKDIVILDDDGDMAHLSHRLIQTSFQTGITESHVEMAIQLFKV